MELHTWHTEVCARRVHHISACNSDRRAYRIDYLLLLLQNDRVCNAYRLAAAIPEIVNNSNLFSHSERSINGWIALFTTQSKYFFDAMQAIGSWSLNTRICWVRLWSVDTRRVIFVSVKSQIEFDGWFVFHLPTSIRSSPCNELQNSMQSKPMRIVNVWTEHHTVSCRPLSNEHK